MKSIRCVFIWLGGVLTQKFPNTVAGVASQFPNSKSLSDVREYVDCRFPEIQLGRLDSKTFCEGLLLDSGIQSDVSEFEDRIIGNFTPRYDVINVIKELPGDLDLWLVSEFPIDWHFRIAKQSGLDVSFSGKTIFTQQSKFTRLIPDIFYYAVYNSGYPKENCLFIDSNTPRIVEAVRLGFSAAVFVDSTRLMREFKLREMIKTTNRQGITS